MMIAQVGVILYMFVVGLELNTSMLREKGHAAVAISHASVVVPFVMGSLLALFVYPRLGTTGASFTTFAMFFGVSLSVTAFPVLARILTDREMTQSALGSVALACAATDDATAWCLLALAVGVAQSSVGVAVLTIGLTMAFVLVMLFVARPVLMRFCCHYDRKQPARLKPNPIAFVLLALLLSALATEAIGIHALFGAFLLGVIIPHDSRIAREFVTKLQDIVSILFLPAFFAYTGMRMQIALVSGGTNVLICLVIIAVATLGKFGGSALAARACGMPWREASAIGILMNTRGLMELIVLNIGLDLGVISPTLFAMMVIMALSRPSPPRRCWTGSWHGIRRPPERGACFGRSPPDRIPRAARRRGREEIDDVRHGIPPVPHRPAPSRAGDAAARRGRLHHAVVHNHGRDPGCRREARRGLRRANRHGRDRAAVGDGQLPHQHRHRDPRHLRPLRELVLRLRAQAALAAGADARPCRRRREHAAGRAGAQERRGRCAARTKPAHSRSRPRRAFATSSNQGWQNVLALELAKPHDGG